MKHDLQNIARGYETDYFKTPKLYANKRVTDVYLADNEYSYVSDTQSYSTRNHKRQLQQKKTMFEDSLLKRAKI